MRPIIYVAHPVAGNVEQNLGRAKHWLKWLQGMFPDAIFIAPWIVEVQIFGDGDEREASLSRICEVVERCDALICVGPRITSGMDRERKHARRVFDCVGTVLPPEVPSGEWDKLSAWIRAMRQDAKLVDEYFKETFGEGLMRY